MSRFERKMSGTERRFVPMPNTNVVICARMKGSVSEDALKAAVLAVRHKHPLLGVRIRLDADGGGWFTQDAVPRPPVRILPRVSGDDWLQVTSEELATAFSIDRGPLIRFVLLASPEASDLLITAHHSICDGRSLIYLIRDLLRHVANPELTYTSEPVIPVVIRDALPASASSNALFRLIVRRINKKWRRKGISFDASHYTELHRTFWKKNRVGIVSWSLTEAQTKTLAAHCSEHRVTVNSALYAAFLTARADIRGDSEAKSIDILVPVDIRDYLTQAVGEAVGFYASAVKVKLKLPSKRSFWEVTRYIHDKIRGQLTAKKGLASQRIDALVPSLMDAMIFAKYGQCDDEMAAGLLRKTGLDKKLTDILISNLGRLDIPVDYGDLKLLAVMGPAVYSDSTELSLEVVTIGGQMQMTLTFPKNMASTQAEGQIRERAMMYLGMGAEQLDEGTRARVRVA